MKQFSVTILGSSAALPTAKRNLSAQVIAYGEQLMLIDCGEGTQITLKKLKIKTNRISHIFISHLHGDHYLGLVGLLSTFHLQGRTNELHLYGQQELMDIVGLKSSGGALNNFLY